MGTVDSAIVLDEQRACRNQSVTLVTAVTLLYLNQNMDLYVLPYIKFSDCDCLILVAHSPHHTQMPL